MGEMQRREILHALDRCCLAVPEAGGGPGVLVLHAWWGLTPFFEAVCRRLAQNGFVALAPDLYQGVTAATDAEAKRLRFDLDSDAVMRKLAGAVQSLSEHPAVHGQWLGVVGFSLGAYLALRLARGNPDSVRAVVVFYANEGGSFEGARASFLGHFASNDGCWVGVRAVRSLETRLRAAGCEVTFHIYADTEHSFFEADRPKAYDAQAAQLAWERTVHFLRSKLGWAGGSIDTRAWPHSLPCRDARVA